MEERCPNCGQLSRVGANFCTICGYRMASDDVAANAPVEPENADAPETNNNGEVTSSETVAGWPVAAVDASAAYAAWAPQPTVSVSVADEAGAGEGAVEELPGMWSVGSTSTWPAPPANGAETRMSSADAELPAVETHEDADAGAEDLPNEGVARERATRLLEELRDAIAAIAGNGAADLSGVISDLEVAVTPPGAVKPEELNELRDALIAARERPRDIDTIVDLTGRVDALMALIFAYDRAIAAIERSLEVLRRA